jgi:hypothetical protein
MYGAFLILREDAIMLLPTDVVYSCFSYSSIMNWMDRLKKKGLIMSNQPENEMQQTLTPEEVRQYLLAELEASKQVVAELSDKELEEAAGGAAVYLPRGSETLIRMVERIGQFGKKVNIWSGR